jgi:hypothetical protein
VCKEEVVFRTRRTYTGRLSYAVKSYTVAFKVSVAGCSCWGMHGEGGLYMADISEFGG